MKQLRSLIAFTVLLIFFPDAGNTAKNAGHFFFGAGFAVKYINGKNDNINLLSPYFSKIVDYGNCGAKALYADPWGLSLKSKWSSGLSIDLGYTVSQKLSLIGTFAGFFSKNGNQKIYWDKEPQGSCAGYHGILDAYTDFREYDWQLALRHRFISPNMAIICGYAYYYCHYEIKAIWHFLYYDSHHFKATQIGRASGRAFGPIIGIEYQLPSVIGIGLVGDIKYSFISVIGGLEMKLNFRTSDNHR